ncbi:EAL domain-containing protein [Acinetobacter junii]|uniref:bifunctional diguanylate cyclase/phosphodiesterase n=1 Tax=Acinetobacter junii TaxID=40215 RepID=UPI0019007F1B|nr:EAL domain-containing protein [Acinetobacter junii]MBJ8440943.1 EAL domain-containing protein [Acinetobacter junii]
MSGVLGKNLPQFIYTDQINYPNHIRLFVVSVIFIILIDYFLFGFFYSFDLNIFSIWTISSLILISIFLIICNFSLKHYTSVRHAKKTNLTFQLICLCIGSLLGVGSVVISQLLIKDVPHLSHSHILTLTALLLTSSHIISLTFLTQHIRYFFLFFIPSVFPLVLSQIINRDQEHTLFYVAYYFSFVATLLCAHATFKIHKRFFQVLEKNKQLIDVAEQHNQWTEELCQQLQREVNKSKDIEAQLQFNNHLLEQKVRERTYDLTKMNERLEEHRQNLAFAHETAGIRPWEWNLEKNTVGVTNSHQKEVTRNSENHYELLSKIVHPDDAERVKNTIYSHLCGQTKRYEETFRIKRSNGDWSWIHDVGQVIQRNPKDGTPLRMVGIHRDINQEKKDQERLKLAASVFEQASEGIFILDENFNYLEVNPKYEQLTGLDKQYILNKHLFEITKQTKQHHLNFHLSILDTLHEEFEYEGEFQETYLSEKSCFLWMHINAVKDESDRVLNYIGIVSDQSERKHQEQRLSYLTNYDTLTDLPNRFYYHQQLHQYLVNEASIQHLAVIRLNIDRFRALNELLSNQAGNELLKQVAQRLRISNIDALLVAHLSADDFAIIYEMSPLHPPIHQICNNIVEAFSKPFYIADQEHVVSISIGVAIYPEHGRQVDNLNTHAEQALTEAKRLGGNTIRYYSSDRTNFVAKHTDLELDLRKAIQNKELVVYYQPKINTQNSNITGFEALIRWKHPTKGLIMPDIFIPLAESTSLISDIGRFVLYEAARQLQVWQKLGFVHIHVAVNIVAQQILRGQLLQDIDAVLDQYSIGGENLELEITESAFLENTENVKMVLCALKERNISIALDDFGTGYSSLAYLTEYPIDILKIDRAFISKIGDPKQDAIVNAMIAMGKTIGLKVVAEGVETEQQRDYLKRQNCDILQGYLFAKPLTASHATDYLQQHMRMSTARYSI